MSNRINQQGAGRSTTDGLAVIDILWLGLKSPALLLIVMLAILFSVLTPNFLTVSNLSNVLLNASIIGLVAVGLTLVIVGGQMDLSVGSVLGLAACIAVGMQGLVGMWAAVALAVMAGTALGILNGLIVERTGVNSFIVTLAGLIGVRGLAFVLFGDTSLSPADPRFATLGAFKIGPIYGLTLIFIGAAFVTGWFMRNSLHGRNTYAIGGSRKAAVDAGIHVSRNVIINFAFCGAMAAVAGVCLSAQLTAATPSFGRDYEIWAVIAVVLGGTRLRGGTGTIIGTVWAVIALAILRNGLNLINVSPFYITMITGLTLIGVLVIDRQISGSKNGAGE
jgi:ribose transport system permease protein